MFPRMRSNRHRRVVALIVVLIAVWITQKDRWGRDEEPTAAGGSVEAAFAAGESDVWLEAAGTVDRILADDDEGSRHQRFILELPGGHTLLVAHNIDLADRVPLARGDRVSLRGEYEWSEQGGVMHWTHHDPKGRKAGGWIEHAGRRYE